LEHWAFGLYSLAEGKKKLFVFYAHTIDKIT